MGVYFAGRFIPFYGACIAAGILAAGIVAYFLVRHRKLDFDFDVLLSAYGLCGGMVGAKALYMIVENEYIQWERIFEWEYWNSLMQGGYVFYGGLIGGLLGLLLGSKIHKINLWSYLETCIPIAHAFGSSLQFYHSRIPYLLGVEKEDNFQRHLHLSIFLCSLQIYLRGTFAGRRKQRKHFDVFYFAVD